MTSVLTSAARRMAPLLLVAQQRAVKQSMIARTMVMVTKTSAGERPMTMNESPVHESSPVANQSVDTNQLHVTDSCMKRIQSLAEKRNESVNEVYLRVYVDAGGCSGFQYKFEMTRDAEEAVNPKDDKVFSQDGCRVVVDEGSLQLIEGSTIDFVQEMIKSGFTVVDNPQSESACGCGSSFAIKNFAANPSLD